MRAWDPAVLADVEAADELDIAPARKDGAGFRDPVPQGAVRISYLDHAMFLIQTPEYMKGIEHAAFHMQGPTSLMLAGNKLRNKGYEPFWGPGRHRFGSNWFWYFKSPRGCAVEYDADMDRLDEAWLPRELPASAEVAQAFLLQAIDKWAPGGPPPEAE